MALPTDAEQEMLELINRLRANPAAEFDKIIKNVSPPVGATSEITNGIAFFGVDLIALRQQLSAFPAVAPLAWNSALNDAASGHSARMIQFDEQSHQLSGEPNLGARLTNAGYDFSNGAENIFAFGSTVLGADAAFLIDWGSGPGGMQSPPGHRQNLLSATFAEIGVDITPESHKATSVGPLVITEDFGARKNYAPQIVGVVFHDLNNDDFYQAGEGDGGVTVHVSGAAGTFTTTTWSTGGYQIAVPQGDYTVTFSGGNLTAPRSHSVTLGAANVSLAEDETDPAGVVPPAIVAAAITPNAGALISGAAVKITLTFNQTVTVTGGIPTLTLKGGGTATWNAALSSATSLAFDYTVGAGQVARTLAVTGISTNNASITGTGGVFADLSAAVASFTGVSINLPAPVTLAGGANVTITTADQTIQLGGGSSRVTLNSTGTWAFGDAGSDYFLDAGGADTINLGTGTTTVSATSGGPVVFGSTISGSLFFSGGAAAGSVYGGAGATTVFANAGGGQFFAGSSTSFLFVGGNGASTAVGGAGRSTLFGGSSGHDLLVAGSGSSTLVGQGSGITLVGRGTAGDVLVAGSGNETLVGSADGGNDILFAGTGSDALFAGTGNDTFVAATGGAEMIAGPGKDEFIFTNGAVGSANTIWNFTQGQDHAALFGYGTNAVANALASAKVASGSTTITLSDNTRITFANIGALRSSDFL